jgi:hypothetical protein
LFDWIAEKRYQVGTFPRLMTQKLQARIVNENRRQRAVERRADDTNKLALDETQFAVMSSSFAYSEQ